MSVRFQVPADDESPGAERRESKQPTIQDLKKIFNTDEGKKFIRDSMALKPVNKQKRRSEIEKMRKSFGLNTEAVTNLKSCLTVKRQTGAIEGVRWRDSGVLVESFRISKIRASCWDDCFYTEVSERFVFGERVKLHLRWRMRGVLIETF